MELLGWRLQSNQGRRMSYGFSREVVGSMEGWLHRGCTHAASGTKASVCLHHQGMAKRRIRSVGLGRTRSRRRKNGKCDPQRHRRRSRVAEGVARVALEYG